MQYVFCKCTVQNSEQTKMFYMYEEWIEVLLIYIHSIFILIR